MSERIAVIVPCFNAGALILETIDSIDEQEPVEIVICDDHSEDPATIAALERLRQRGYKVLRHERNQGAAAARNTALAASSAPYVFPLDSDDLAGPGAMGKMADVLDADPNVGVCFGDFEEIRPDPPRFAKPTLIRAVPERIDPYRLAFTNEFPATALFRRTMLEEIGGWEDPHTDILGFEDWDLWMKIAEGGYEGRHVGVGVVVFSYRIDEPGLLVSSRSKFRPIYKRLKERHPKLFGNISEYRRESDLPWHRRVLYPIVYGARPRSRLEWPVKRLFDRVRFWSLQR